MVKNISISLNIDSELSPWTDWTPCSKSCGTGDRTRTRNCVLKDCPICAFGRDEKNPCGAPLFERQLCNQQVCLLIMFQLTLERTRKSYYYIVIIFGANRYGNLIIMFQSTLQPTGITICFCILINFGANRYVSVFNCVLIKFGFKPP